NGGIKGEIQKPNQYSPSEQANGKLLEADSTRSTHVTRITGDAQSAPCSPLADVRNWYWKRVERSNHPNCTKCSVRKSPCASKQSDACMVHTDRSVGRRICSDPQSATMLVQPCSQSPCAVLNGDITRPRRVDNHEDGTNHTRYTPGCPVIRSVNSKDISSTHIDSMNTVQIFDPNGRANQSALTESQRTKTDILHRLPVDHRQGRSDTLEATLFALSKSTTPYVLTADNRIARLSKLEAEIFRTSSSTMVLHNDLHATDDRTGPGKAYQTESNEIACEVTLERCHPQQRFGMKLDRTDSPEKVNWSFRFACITVDKNRDTEETVRKNWHSLTNGGFIGEGKYWLTISPTVFDTTKVLVIDVVLTGSPAASAGLQAGQRLLSLNGKSVLGWDQREAMNWLRAYPNDTDLAVTVGESPERSDSNNKSPRNCSATDHPIQTEPRAHANTHDLCREAFDLEPNQITSSQRNGCPCQLLRTHSSSNMESPSFPSSSASFVNTTEEYEQIHTCRPFTVLLECTHFANRLTHPNGNTGDQSNSRDSGQQSSTRPISKHPGYCICPFQHCTDGQSTVQPVYCILDQQQSEQYQRDLVGRMMCTGIHVNQTKEMDHTGHGLDDSMNSTIRTSQDYV
ncbi:hypothetical protein FBUS_03355, partial [Fasciolopsis buskii]